MSKTQIFKITIFSALLALLLNILAGRFLLAKISTWPLLNRLHILSPQAPIVITNRETVRVSDSGDVVQAAGDMKSKISVLMYVNGSTDLAVGAALNLTSDGSFVTGAGAFGKAGGSYFVVLSDGRSGKVISQTPDLATGLIFFKADLSNVPVANFAASKDASVGEKIIFAANSPQNFTTKVFTATINSAQNDISGQVFLSDYPRRSFGAASPGPLENGEVVADTGANILGLWNGTNIISSDVLKQAMDLYFANNQSLVRPSFGFSYSIITANDSALSGQNQGALVLAVTGSAAKQAGLEAGDIITLVDANQISETSPLEEILSNYKVGGQPVFTVIRKNQTLNLTLTTAELK